MGARWAVSIASTQILRNVLRVNYNYSVKSRAYRSASYMEILLKSKKIDHFSRAPASKTVFVTVRARARENLAISSYRGDKIAVFDCSWQLE